MNTKQTAIDQILTRGVEQILPNRRQLAALMERRKIRVYLGIDPTGSLLTLGHSVVLRKLQQFAELGHEVILLIGNATVRIGDPTGKDKTRPELTDREIEANFQNWKKQAAKVLDFDQITVRYNAEWLDKLNLKEIIKLLAKTTVQQLLERDMFQKRLQNQLPIHTHELIYPLLQGYDSVALDVDLEIGGTDQTFNMMMGRQLQKIYRQKEKFVLTTPIINGLDGRKMSKSLGNFIALTEEPNNMYGKLMKIADEQIMTYFDLLTDLPKKEIEKIGKEIENGQNPMEFKKILAWEITKMYHSPQAANQAQQYFQLTIQQKQAQDYLFIDGRHLTALALAQSARPQESKSQLRRLIAQGSLQINGQKITDPNQNLDLQNNDQVKIGKKYLFKIKIKK